MAKAYSKDPTARADEMAEELRTWYEANRESYWDRCKYSKNKQLLNAGCADDFMLKLLAKAVDIAKNAGEVKEIEEYNDE